MHTVGMDVGKRHHVAVILDANGQQVGKALRFANDQAGFGQLLERLAAVGQISLIGLEATGHYWLGRYTALAEAGYNLVVLNALPIHAYRQSGLGKRKNDRYDAYWMADYIRISQPPPPPQPQPALLPLRERTRFRASLTDQRGDGKRKVISTLDRVFPEYEKLFSRVFIQTSRRLLAEALTPDEFADFDLTELTQRLTQTSRGRHGQAKAEASQALARRSGGIGFLGDVLRVQMTCLLPPLPLLDGQRQQLAAEITALMAPLPQHITSIPGIGSVTGAIILAEIGDGQRFAAPEKLVAYAGIDPTVYQSGQFTAAQTRMSKRGSPSLRHALWQAAFMATQHDPQLRDFYQRKRAEGKAHGTAVGALCRKLLHRIYVVLKEERPYVIRDSLLMFGLSYSLTFYSWSYFCRYCNQPGCTMQHTTRRKQRQSYPLCAFAGSGGRKCREQ